MIAKPVLHLLADLGAPGPTAGTIRATTTRSSKAFPDLQIPTDFPKNFDSFEDAHAHCGRFFICYNDERLHSDIGHNPRRRPLPTRGLIREQRGQVLHTAYAAHSEEFVRKARHLENYRRWRGSTDLRRHPDDYTVITRTFCLSKVARRQGHHVLKDIDAAPAWTLANVYSSAGTSQPHEHGHPVQRGAERHNERGGSSAQCGGESTMACIAGQLSLGQIRASFFTLARPSRFVIRGVPQNVQTP